MTKFTRREFLKTAALSSAALAALVGLSPVLDWRKGQPHDPLQAVLATTCSGCPAGCGLVATVSDGRVCQVAGNPNHPLNRGKDCTKRQVALQEFAGLDRVKAPLQWEPRGSGISKTIDWANAIDVVKSAFQKFQPGEIAFLMGPFPDHLYDLVQILSTRLGNASVLRLDLRAELEGRVTLMDATQRLFGVSRLPYFDIGRADVVFSFGSNLEETWLSLPAESLSAGRSLDPNRMDFKGHVVQFGPHSSRAAAGGAEWIPVKPGTEGLLAQVMARLCAEHIAGRPPDSSVSLDSSAIAEACGVPLGELKRLARLFVEAQHKLAVPGGAVLGQTHGLAVGEAVLALNALVGNLGKPGGVFLTPDLPVFMGSALRPSTFAELAGFIERLRSGQVKALFIHGVDPLADLPGVFGFADALGKAELVVSFASFYDQTAMQADYIFPDRPPLESWGYQRCLAASQYMAISGLQPVLEPLEGSLSTADLLLAAAPATAPAFRDEMDFIQKSLFPLMTQGGVCQAECPEDFWEQWLQHGGWWKVKPGLLPPVPIRSVDQTWKSATCGEPVNDHRNDDHQNDAHHSEVSLLVFVESNLAGFTLTGGKLCSASQSEKKIRLEIHPETARSLGVHVGDIARVTSPAGEIQGVVCECKTVQLDCVAIPLERGQAGNPLDLLGLEQNESGCLASVLIKVRVTKAEI